MNDDAKAVMENLNEELFTIGSTSITAMTAIVCLLVVLAAWMISILIQRANSRFLGSRGFTDEGSIRATNRLAHYTIMTLGVGVALHTLGVNLAALFTAGAFFAVALGFAMQNVTENFVSGIILLAERTIKPGDIVVVNDEMVRVTHMGIRATVARTLDDDDIIIPNATLVSSAVTNRTLRDPEYRLRAMVGVEYASDMTLVRKVLEDTAREVDWRDPSRDPVVLLRDFGASSVDWEVSVWIANPFQESRRLSQLREAIWFALLDANVTIAFPQMDVHLDPPVVEALTGGSPRTEG